MKGFSEIRSALHLALKNWFGFKYSGENEDLEAGEYRIGKSLDNKGVYIIGGDDIGTLYGAYRYAEHLGVRFYLHGDVVPDGMLNMEFARNQ